MENQEGKKENFFKRAFREMKESAQDQHEVDKANFAAIRYESKANFEENRGKNTLKRAKENTKKTADERKMKRKEEQAKQIVAAKTREESAKKRIENAQLARKENQ